MIALHGPSRKLSKTTVAWGKVTKACCFVAISMMLAIAVAHAQTPPPNDDFSNAVVLSGSASSGSTSGTNVDATKEIGEPNHAGDAGGSSVWWQWTPNLSANITFSTAN